MKSEESFNLMKQKSPIQQKIDQKYLPKGLEGVIAYYKFVLRVEGLILNIPFWSETGESSNVQKLSVWINFNKHRSDAQNLVIALKSLLSNSLHNMHSTSIMKTSEGQSQNHLNHNSFYAGTKNASFETFKDFPDCSKVFGNNRLGTTISKISFKKIAGLQEFAKLMFSQRIHRKSEIIKLQYFIRKFIESFIIQNKITKHEWTDDQIYINRFAFLVLDFFICFYQLNTVLIDDENFLNFEKKTCISKITEIKEKMNRKILKKLLQKIKKIDFDIQKTEPQQK